MSLPGWLQVRFWGGWTPQHAGTPTRRSSRRTGTRRRRTSQAWSRWSCRESRFDNLRRCRTESSSVRRDKAKGGWRGDKLCQGTPSWISGYKCCPRYTSVCRRFLVAARHFDRRFRCTLPPVNKRHSELEKNLEKNWYWNCFNKCTP